MDDQVADPPGDGAGGEYQPDNQQGLYPDSVLPASTPGDQDATPYYERKCLDASCAKSPGESDAVEEVPPSGSHDGAGKAPPPDAEADLSEDCPPPPPMLSDAAARARLRRVCQPNSKGEYKVPQEVVDKFKDAKGGREDLMKQFERCAHDPDGCAFHAFQVEIPQTNFQQRAPGLQPTNIYHKVGNLVAQ